MSSTSYKSPPNGLPFSPEGLEDLEQQLMVAAKEQDSALFEMAALAIKRLRPKPHENYAPYGRCPHCGGKGLQRERRPNGNDTCENGHVYPSAHAVMGQTAPEGLLLKRISLAAIQDCGAYRWHLCLLKQGRGWSQIWYSRKSGRFNNICGDPIDTAIIEQAYELPR